jgi:cytochrome P450
VLQPDKVDIYPKISITFKGITSLLGEGLVFSEGNTWKVHRKVISKLFTFDMLLDNIPKISEICDRVLDSFEKDSQVAEKQFCFNAKHFGEELFSSIILKCFLGVGDCK